MKTPESQQYLVVGISPAAEVFDRLYTTSQIRYCPDKAAKGAQFQYGPSHFNSLYIDAKRMWIAVGIV